MAITYTKNIIEVKKVTHNNIEDVICEIRWRLVGTDELGNVEELIAVDALNVENYPKTNFIVSNDITDDQLFELFKVKIDPSSFLEKRIADKLAIKSNSLVI